MISMGFANTSVRPLSELQPGQFFLHRQMDTVSLAIKINWMTSSGSAWLNLTGSNAFKLDADTHGRKNVLHANIDLTRLQLRIDHTSLPPDDRQHPLGKVVMDDRGKAGIAVVWTGLEDKDHRNVILLDGWEQTSVYTPSFIFDRWALSYPDETSQWVDLVRFPLSGA